MDGVNIETRFYEILEEKGGKVADEARRRLLEGVPSPHLNSGLRYVVETWRDTFRPSLTILSCEAVGGKPESVTSIAIAISLFGVTLNIWNDIADHVKHRRFRLTIPAKLGVGSALIIGGWTTAKAYHLLSTSLQAARFSPYYPSVNQLVLDLASGMAEAETQNFSLRQQKTQSYHDKMEVFEKRAIHLRCCMELGALLVGSRSEIAALSRYGSRFGVILELREDLEVSLNRTLELANKIKRGFLPYTLHWLKDHSNEARNLLSSRYNTQMVTPGDVKKIVELMFASGTVTHVVETVKKLEDEAVSDLRHLEETEATRLLRILVQAQHALISRTFTGP